MTRIQMGGLLTIFSKHIFINVRKKNAVKSKNTIKHRRVIIGVELY